MEGAKPPWRRCRSSTPLMILRYSATHKIEHNKVHRLDALDAYNQKLVKKIAVRGITVEGPRRHQRLPVPGRASRSPRRPPERPRRAGGADARPARSSAQLQAPRARATTCTTCPAASRQYQDGFVVIRHRRQPATPSSFTNGVVARGRRGHRRRDRERHAPHPDPRGHQGAPRQGAGALRPGHQGAVAVLHRRGGQVPRLRPADEKLGDYARVFEEEYALLEGGVPGRARDRRTRPTRSTSKGIDAAQDPPRLLLDRQEDQAPGRPGDVARARSRASPTTSTPTT